MAKMVSLVLHIVVVAGLIIICGNVDGLILPSSLSLNVTQLSLIGRQTFYSTVARASSSDLAVDGNFENDFSGGVTPCFYTIDDDGGPNTNWWSVDLGSDEIKVNEVIVLNRLSTFAFTLDNFIVGITNSTPSLSTVNRNDYQRCGQFSGEVKSGAFASLRCRSNSPKGRYLIIQQAAGGGGQFTLCEVNVWIEMPQKLPLKDKETFASSVHVRSKSSNAVDGNYESEFNRNDPRSDHPCFHSWDEPGDPNWWAVDLGERIDVYEVVLLNRGDCCADRLDNFIVGVTNSTPSLSTIRRGSYPLCGKYDRSVEAGALVAIRCRQDVPKGRYLVIQQRENGPGLMTICEVEVWLDYVQPKLSVNTRFVNLKDNPTFSSSEGTVGGTLCRSTLAVNDRFQNTYAPPKACTCFESNGNDGANWWAVELGASPVKLDAVLVQSRKDPGFENRLADFIVGVSSSTSIVRGNYPICGVYEGTVPLGAFAAVRCRRDIPDGRYLVIQQPENGPGFLTICEVQVYIEFPKVPDDVIQLQLIGHPTYSSSVHFRSQSSYAVDGLHETFFNRDNYPCFHSWDEPGDPNWWAVDMDQKVIVYEVSLLNRGDCCGDRLEKFIVGVTNIEPSLATVARGRYPLCGVYDGETPPGEWLTLRCSIDTPDGRYLIVQQPLAGRGLLTICEVQVYIEHSEE